VQRTYARIAGLFYVLNFATAGLVLLVGWVGYALNIVTYLVVTVMVYELFKAGAPTLSRLAATFSLTGCAIQATACLFLLAGQPALHKQGYIVGLVFFGFYCAAIGALILRTRLLPRAIGALMLLSGISWLTFLWPPFATTHAFVRVLGAVGEAAFTLSLFTLYRAPVECRGCCL
jgi:hypothetical protein